MSLDLDRSAVSLLTNIENMRIGFNKGLRSVHIVNLVEQRIFNFQVEYWLDSNRKIVATPEVIYEEFQYRTDPDVGESIQYVVETLQERYSRNILNDTVMSYAEKVTDDWRGAAKLLVENALTTLKKTDARTNKTNFATSVSARRERYEKAAKFDGSVKGAPLGLKEVDEHTYGIQDGEVAVLGAFAKTGKTHALVNAAVQARREGYTPFVATLEIPTKDFEDRMDAVASGVCLERLQAGRLTKEELKKLHEAQDEFAALGDVHVEKLGKGDRTVKLLCSRAREMGANYLIIDQLSFLESARATRSATDTVAEVFPDLVANVSEDEDDMLPVLIAAQLNRKSKEKDAKMGMQHLALSSTLEQYAHIIYGLSATDEDRQNNTMNLAILGSRRVRATGWKLEWKLTDKTTKFGVIKENKSLLENS